MTTLLGGADFVGVMEIDALFVELTDEVDDSDTEELALRDVDAVLVGEDDGVTVAEVVCVTDEDGVDEKGGTTRYWIQEGPFETVLASMLMH